MDENKQPQTAWDIWRLANAVEAIAMAVFPDWEPKSQPKDEE